MNIIIILICQKLGSVGPVQQKIKLPLPQAKKTVFSWKNVYHWLLNESLKLEAVARRFTKNCNFIKKEAPVFSYIFCTVSENTFL